jgi:hypothetical protein
LLPLLLLLSASAPGLDDLFDPFSREFPVAGKRVQLRQAAFEYHLKRRGPGGMLKAMRRCEKAIVEARRHRDKVHARFLKARAAYFGWMEKYAKKYRRKEGRDPAHYPMPDSINKSFIAHEDAMKAAGAVVQGEFYFHRWALDRLLALAPEADAKFIAAMRSECKAKSPHQRLRAARLLAVAPGVDSSDLLAKASHPAVLAELARSSREIGPALLHAHWVARAGAIAACKDPMTLVGRWDRESGRLRDDLHGALSALAAQADWEGWLEDWKPAPLDGKEDRLRVAAMPSPSGRTCFGLPTGSERFVLCVLAMPGVETEVLRFLGTVPERAQFAVVRFGSGAKAFKPVSNTATSRKALAKWFGPLGDRNDLWAGLDLAFDLAEKMNADTLILFNPTRPTLVGDSPALVTRPVQMHYELAYRNELRGIRILGNGTSGGGDSYYLQALARQFKGGFIPTPTDR